MGYFSEAVGSCAGCDHCSRRTRPQASDPAVKARLTRLRRALASQETPWAGAVLEPETLLRLAKHPPGSAAELANVVGVGPVVAENMGRRILEALGSSVPSEDGSTDPCVRALRDWRSEVGRRAGIPDHVVVGDEAIAEMARLRPKEIPVLARISGLGPRFLRKWGEEVLALIQGLEGEDSG